MNIYLCVPVKSRDSLMLKENASLKFLKQGKSSEQCGDVDAVFVLLGHVMIFGWRNINIPATE